MQVRTTPKMIVARFGDWRKSNSCGPADVYFCRKNFARAAQMRGWGDDVSPNKIVDHMGDKVTLFDVLYSCLSPVRVRHL